VVSRCATRCCAKVTLTISAFLEVVEGTFREAEVQSDQVKVFLNATASAPLEHNLNCRCGQHLTRLKTPSLEFPYLDHIISIHRENALCAGRHGRSAVLRHGRIDGFQLLDRRVVVDWDAEGRNAAETSPFVMAIMAMCENAIWCEVLFERA
jgi:hypothetical protein